MTLPIVPAKAGITLDPLSQYGALGGLLLGGLLPMLLGKKDEDKVTPSSSPRLQNLINRPASAQAASAPNIPVYQPAPAQNGMGSGYFPNASAADQQAYMDANPDMRSQMMPPAAQPTVSGNASGNTGMSTSGTGNATLEKLMSSLTGNAGGLAGLGGTDSSKTEQSPLEKLASSSQVQAPAQQQWLPQQAQSSGPNANLLQALLTAASTPNQFGSPFGPAGGNPLLAFQRRLAAFNPNGMNNNGMG